jgi:hypothetical protein
LIFVLIKNINLVGIIGGVGWCKMQGMDNFEVMNGLQMEATRR